MLIATKHIANKNFALQ